MCAASRREWIIKSARVGRPFPAGKIVEEGNYQELMALGGRFRELYESQQKEEQASERKPKISPCMTYKKL